MSDRTHYEVLDLLSGATDTDIKTAIRRHQRRHHPDVGEGGDEGEYIRGQEAAAVLSDPVSRAEYDHALAHPEVKHEPEDDGVPLDSWVSESVVQEATPAPEPAVESKAPVAEPKPTSVYDLGPSAWAISAVTAILLLVMPLVVVTTVADTTAWAISSVVLAVAAIVGYFNLVSSASVRHVRQRMTTGNITVSVALVLIAVASWWAATYLPPAQEFVGAGAGVLVAAAGGYLLGTTASFRYRDGRILRKKTLASGQWFGTIASGELPAYLNRALEKTKGEHFHVFRLETGLFSHLVITGRTVLLLRAVSGSGGHYRWSGQSLLRENNGNIQQVAAGDFERVMKSVQKACSRKILVHAAVVIVGAKAGSVQYSTEAGQPEITGIEDLSINVGPDDHRVCRSAAIDALIAASTASAA